MKIAEVEVNLDAISKLSKEHRAAVFAHLKGDDKKRAVQKLDDALAKPPKKRKADH